MLPVAIIARVCSESRSISARQYPADVVVAAATGPWTGSWARSTNDLATSRHQTAEARGEIKRRRSMTSATDPKPMSRTLAILYAIGLPLALLALVFLPAGRIDWAPGWIFIAILVAAFGVSALLLARVNPMIYRARSRFQPGTEKWDLILLAVMLP